MEDSQSRPKRKKADVTASITQGVGKVSVEKKDLDEIVAFVKKNRPRSLTAGERLDILLLHRYEHAEKERNNDPGTPIEAPQISKTISKMLRRNIGVVAEV